MKKSGPLLLAAFLSLAPAAAFADAASLERGVALYGEGRWRESVLELRRAAARAETPEAQAEPLYWIGLAELASADYEAALQDLDASLKASPQGPRAREAAYQKGRVLYYLGRYDQAVVLLKTYADTAGDDQRKAAALYWIGECLFSLGRMEDARMAFASLMDAFPSSVKYEAAAYRLSLIDQKGVEAELLKLLKWSHEESLKTVEEYQRRERSYEQAMVAYQKRIAEMLKDTRLSDLEQQNKALAAQAGELEARLARAEARAEDAEAKAAAAEARASAAAEAKPAAAPVAAPSSGGAAEKLAALLVLKSRALDVKESIVERLAEGAKGADQ